MQRVQHVACFVSHAAPRKMVSIVVYYSKQGCNEGGEFDSVSYSKSFSELELYSDL